MESFGDLRVEILMIETQLSDHQRIDRFLIFYVGIINSQNFVIESLNN